ncbi:conserved domain protein [Eggerthella sp. HGA1]|nr:conserved domain protein [Eggerthella sp. HGA1]
MDHGTRFGRSRRGAARTGVAFRLVKRENIRLRCQGKGLLCASCFVFGLFNAEAGESIPHRRPPCHRGRGGRARR